MKQVILLSIALLLVGCALPPPAETAGESSQDLVVVKPDTGQPAAQPAAQPVVQEAVVETQVLEVADANETMNETNQTKPLVISGSTKLQTDTELCPHLQARFECNRYDLRSCNFKNIMGKNDFYPDYVICRPGETAKGEDNRSKFCFVQECTAVAEGGIVQSYGGLVAYAEYGYSESKTADGGIMTTYSLKRCGEVEKSFEEKFDCQTYYSEWRNLWD